MWVQQTGVSTADPLMSVLLLLIIGMLAGKAAALLRLPRIVGMIVVGIAVYPVLHPSLTGTITAVTYTVNSLNSVTNMNVAAVDPARPDPALNPASAIRTVALLIALMRGGLSVKVSFFQKMGVATALLATVPYAFELIVMALLAPMIVPQYFSTAPALASFTSASVWAALSPSICIPNMLTFVEQGLTEAGSLVLTGAPLEVSTALVTEGVMDGVLTAQASSTLTSDFVLGHIPTYVLGSALYGLAFAGLFYALHRVRALPQYVAYFGKPDPIEPLFFFVCCFLLCYCSSIDNINVPYLVGFFAALCMAIGTQYLLPELADELCVALKGAWYFAECFLFILTGCVIRPAIDAGLSQALFGNFLALLVCGSLARMVGDAIVGVVWQWGVLKAACVYLC